MHATKIWAITLIGLVSGMPAAQAQWTGMTDGPNEYVSTLCYDSLNDRLYAFGRFLEAGGQVVNGTTFLEDGQWHPMGEGVENVFAWSVMDAYLRNDSVMISGAFNTLVGVPNTKRIALWNGSEWKSIGGLGGNGNAAGMLANEDGWTMAGGFTEMGGIPSNSIARYRNGEWEDLCVYPDNSGYKHYSALAKYQGQYIFGGNINGDFPDLNEIGVLLNDSLRPMGSGILGDSWVNDMKVYDGKLFVGGEFYAGWGNPGSGIMIWDGENWSDPIPGVQCATQVFDMDVFDGKLFFSGYMLLPGSSDFYTLAMYTPGQICLFGKNLTAAMNAIAGVPGGLYVAPNYPDLVVDGVPLGVLALYDISQGFDTCLSLPVGIGEPEWTDDRRLHIHPNPNYGTFQVDLPAGFKAQQVVVYDALGNEVDLMAKARAPGTGSISVELQARVPGIYLVRISGSDGATYLTGRVIVH
ncbi:MAG: T9SS type A sorting domain-containing protein [Flavobacteriales bacterium]|jgi:hypothetical protein|nr:T9SS type A sorting domain-containing protein [Flavobacteriales bacterium]